MWPTLWQVFASAFCLGFGSFLGLRAAYWVAEFVDYLQEWWEKKAGPR